VLYYRDWQGMGTQDRVAFLDNKVRKTCQTGG